MNRFLPWFPLKNIEEAKIVFKEKYERKYVLPKGYDYGLCLKKDNRPIGYINVDMGEAHDLGYGLRKEFWNKGIITEGVRAVIEQLKKDNMNYITATHDINNPASGRVMEKLGMEYKYSYIEQWQPKDIAVTFRMYQLNLDGDKERVFEKYMYSSKTYFVESI